MPTRSRQSNSRAVAQPDKEEGPYNIPNLQFNEPLSWRAGRAISVADLFTRLQKLSNELRTAEQGVIEVKDIAQLAQDLVHPNLLGHKDKGIRAWTVQCVVDVLQICAPNAPYRPGQLKDIFTVFVSTILPALADPTNAYNAQHQYILDQLVDSQSIVLITDIQDVDSLLCQLFTICFDIVSGSGRNPSGTELSPSVEFQIGILLNTVVDEAALPQDVIDIIIAQFLRVDPRSSQQLSTRKKDVDAKDKTQSTLLLKEYPPAYKLAKAICAACSDKMSGAISQYFSSIITSASAAFGEDEGKVKASKRNASPSSNDGDDGQESRKDLTKAHRLVRELWRACPDVLINVIPQLEIELAADAVELRKLAVETLGDIVAGIGLAGLPELPLLDPAAFPLPTIEDTDIVPLSNNPLLAPTSPKPFIHVHSATYQAFLGRRIDKAVHVRKAWADAASRILLTRAGGIRLNDSEQSTLVTAYAALLRDVDDSVRLTALQNLERFPYSLVIEVLGSDGGLSQPSSLLSAIGERSADKKQQIRNKAMLLLGSMWGVASRDIANGIEQVLTVLGQAPSRLLATMYVKDSQVGAMLPEILYTCLLPLAFPSSKGKSLAPETQNQNGSNSATNLDAIRVRRLLALVRDLDDRAKPVFFGIQKRQADMSKGVTTFLNTCEDYNAGVADDPADEKRLRDQLKRYIDSLSRQLSDPKKASEDLWTFAKTHDRRSYQLIKFSMGPEHDFRTMTKAVKELNKRTNNSSLLGTLMSLLYQCALISYSRSHIPAIMEYARSDESGLSETAQEVLSDISERVPEVMKSHIQVLCRELEEAAPTEIQSQSDTQSAADALKACAAFAKRFPQEMPQDRKFWAAMMHFVQFSFSPKAAKHAANIVLIASDKKELRAKEILSKAIQKFNSGATNKLAQLAAIAQVCLLAPQAAGAEEDAITKIAISDTLHKNLSSETSDYEPSAWNDSQDEDATAKMLALKVLINQCRAGNDKNSEIFKARAESTIDVLVSIVAGDGEITPTKDTPSTQRNHLRLAATSLLVKLCRHKPICEDFVTPTMFHTIAWTLVNPPYGVRRGLIAQIKKYSGQNKLSARWTTILFLLAFEPDTNLRVSTMAWLKSRTAYYSTQQKRVRSAGEGEKKSTASNVMEIVFARLLSLLVHHPDHPIKTDATYDGDLLDFAKYIVFYLQCCASDENLSLIFHIAQRVKQVQDAISAEADIQERLYVLSDLAQATIRNYADQMPSSAKGMNLLQMWPGKAHLPALLFKPISGHARAQEIAAKNHLPEEVAVGLEHLVRKMIKHGRQSASTKSRPPPNTEKKRKASISSDMDDDEVDSIRKSAKRGKTRKTSTSLPIRKTPNPKKRKSEAAISVEQPSRKSARTSTATKVNYEESDDDEEAEEDPEAIVKYKPAPVDQYKHKSKRSKETPELDDIEAATDQEEEQADEGALASPTPKEKEANKKVEPEENQEEAEEPNDQIEDEGNSDDGPHDTEMTNGNGEVQQTNGADEDADKTVDSNEESEVELEAEDGTEAEESEPEPSPPRSNKRASRAKIPTLTAKPKGTSKAKSIRPPKQVKTASKPKAAMKAAQTKSSAPKAIVASSPATEPVRRTTRRTKA